MMIVRKEGFIVGVLVGSTATIMIRCAVRHLPQMAAHRLDDYQVPLHPAASR